MIKKDFNGIDKLALSSNKIWKEAVEASDNEAAKGIAPERTALFWDEVSTREQKKNSEDTKRIADVLSMLKSNNALENNGRCLDVGCGKGLFSLEFAQEGMIVDCYDLSQGMLDYTQALFEEKGLKRPGIIRGNWQEDDLALQELDGKYDLVFSSLNPAVTSPETLNKMTSCSKKWCMYLYSAGGWHSDEYEELDKIVLGKSMTVSGFNEICFPFNHLYCKGYFPIVSYTSSEWTNSMSPEAAIDAICKRYSKRVELSSVKTKVIENYVAEHITDGQYVQHIVWNLGMLLWHV